MGLQAGGQLGIYEILSLLGTGGMGEVYRARDTKLNREVALKVLPETMASDPQRMARFEREARTLASLNHPNIAAIYGLETSNGVTALVMELVEGETLEERIARSSNSHASKSGGRAGLQPEDSLQIARQIAEALEYAHERGVVHRDLKPANVKITPEGAVKVLDFGLAKVMSNDSSASLDPSNSPTLSVMATQMGIILGTAAYMAPEQAKGKQVDRRVDIWAFGCVLYEMLTSQKPFQGETISDILAAVIRAEPDWTLLPNATSPPMQRLIRRCMEKDPKQRLQAIGEARIAIEKTLAGDLTGESINYPEAVGKKSLLHRALPWAAAIVFAATTAWVAFQPKPQPKVMRFRVQPQESTLPGYSPEATLSPDGRTLAYVAQGGPNQPDMIWLRSLDSLTAHPLPGTEGVYLPFWSPDSRSIGFCTLGALETVALSGGPPQTLYTSTTVLGGGTWNRDGFILFATNGSLYRVPAAGGQPTLVASPDASAVGYPQFLPDGRHFLFLSVSSGPIGSKGTGGATVKVGSLDSKKTRTLLTNSSDALYAKPGYLFYVIGGNLMARAFDARSLKFTGQAVAVAENIHTNVVHYAPFSVSQSGELAYVAGGSVGQDEMAWFDRKGKRIGTVGQQGNNRNPALSPDGSGLAIGSAGINAGAGDIWVYDSKRGTGSRLTFAPASNDLPAWSPDGSRIYFSSNRSGKVGIYEKPADGVGQTQQIFLPSRGDAYLNYLSPDGRYALFFGSTSKGGEEWALPLSGDGKPFVYLQGRPLATQAVFSPNGRYVAYASVETGRFEVYVQTFPQHQGKWQISTAGGMVPMWRSDGKELFYLDPKNELMSAAVSTGSSSFQAGTAKPLFLTQLVPLGYWRNSYIPSPDGQRFLMLVPASQAKPSPITVVLNWQTLVKKN